MYNDALSDMNLTTDPWTMNRYAFGGGNPVSMVELDGHLADPFGGGGISSSSSSGYSPSDFGHDVLGVGKGAWYGLKDTGIRLWNGGQFGWRFVTDQGDTRQRAYDTASYVIHNPGETATAVWHGITDPIVNDWNNGDKGQAIGRGIEGIAELFVGAKGATKLAKLSKVGKGAAATGAFNGAVSTGEGFGRLEGKLINVSSKDLNRLRHIFLNLMMFRKIPQ